MGRIAAIAALLLPAVAQAQPSTPGQSPPSPADATRTPAAAIVRRLMPPTPDPGRMGRALAIAGLSDAVSRSVIEDATARAAAGFDAWRPAAGRALEEELGPELERAPGSTVPASRVRNVIGRWDEGLRFELDALDALLAAHPASSAASAELARSALRALQAQALVPLGGRDGPPDLRSVDLLEAALARGAASVVPAADLRTMLAGYEAERARLLRRVAEAAVESESRRPEANRIASEWSQSRTAQDADPRQDPFTVGEWRRLAFALEMAPVLDASAKLVDLQRRTATQAAAALDPVSAWCLYAALLASGRSEPPARRMAALEARADALPAELREAARATVREFCTSGRPALEREVDALALASESSAAAVRATAAPGGMERADLGSIDAQLRASMGSGAGFGARGSLGSVQEALSDLGRRLDRLSK